MFNPRAFLAVTAPAAIIFMVSAHAQSRVFEFDIPAGELRPAIDRFAHETNTQIFFKSEATEGKTTPGVRGRLTEDEALRKLLSDSGLAILRDVGGAMVLLRQATKPPELQFP